MTEEDDGGISIKSQLAEPAPSDFFLLFPVECVRTLRLWMLLTLPYHQRIRTLPTVIDILLKGASNNEPSCNRAFLFNHILHWTCWLRGVLPPVLHVGLVFCLFLMEEINFVYIYIYIYIIFTKSAAAAAAATAIKFFLKP